ncbi:MAG TPA: TIGR04053 family radical SAM/SPASM domain-containing protein [Actinomycetota bacterium]|jgi:radical SAM protein|nr:TIGR04053 family radical SAM/SPASM domain-containing protein [Actinomycetota bacterium]
MSPVNFEQAPILLFWETTKACDLACRHCRAEAIAEAMPGQLSTEEGMRLIDRLSGFTPRFPVIVFTGGDPFKRADLFELAAHARSYRMPIGFAPSVTPLLTPEAAVRMREVGARTVSISLDGAVPATHEGVRGIEGHFRETERAVRMLVEEGHTVQINTTVMRRNLEELADVAALVSEWGAHIWEVFFLIRVGRGSALEDLAPEENEDVVHLLYEASRYGFIVRTVEAPFFRRVVAQRRVLDPGADPARTFGLGPWYRRLTARLRERLGEPGSSRAQSVGTRDGKGILFVGHDGDVYPAGFLPYRLGNVRRDDIVELYRSHPLLRSIRATEFGGRCGVCAFADACGGSRARAFASSGDPLAEDPACAFRPAAVDAAVG